MVPVPEELVDQVKNYMAWKLTAPKIVERPDALREVFDEADPGLRRLMSHVAEVTHADGMPTLIETAEECGMSPREVVGSFGDLHTRLRAAGRQALLVMPRVDPRERPDDVSEWHHRVLNMTEADAAVIVEF